MNETPNTITPQQQVQYDDTNIRHLSDVEHIRTRPGMYIGRLDDGSHAEDGIYVLLKETIDNSIDEFRMNAGKRIEIDIDDHLRVRVRDYGRGIPQGKPTIGSFIDDLDSPLSIFKNHRSNSADGNRHSRAGTVVGGNVREADEAGITDRNTKKLTIDALTVIAQPPTIFGLQVGSGIISPICNNFVMGKECHFKGNSIFSFKIFAPNFGIAANPRVGQTTCIVSNGCFRSLQEQNDFLRIAVQQDPVMIGIIHDLIILSILSRNNILRSAHSGNQGSNQADCQQQGKNSSVAFHTINLFQINS